MAARRACENRECRIALGKSGPYGVAMLWLRGGFSCRRKVLCSSPSSRLPQDVCILCQIIAWVGDEGRS